MTQKDISGVESTSSTSGSASGHMRKKQKTQQGKRDDDTPSILTKGIVIAATTGTADINCPEDIDTASDKEELTIEETPMSDSELPPDYRKLNKKQKRKNKKSQT